MLRALRTQVQLHLNQVPARRKPALRRTEHPDALLATDLPCIADDAAVEGFIRAMEADGWRMQREGDWLLLDHAVPVPQAEPPVHAPGEWGCCLHLLQLHPSSDAPQEMIRALVKAADMGPTRVEWLCRQWHGEFAACLRDHKPLPGGLLPYLLAAMKEEEQ